MRNGQLRTDEVTLYYTIRGSGPMLLILQGGAGNADGSEYLANQLAGDFTVVTYDRRGLSRSTPIQAERYDIAAHGDDAARLITALTDEPAFVFGSSIGALIGLELAAHRGAGRSATPPYRSAQDVSAGWDFSRDEAHGRSCRRRY